MSILTTRLYKPPLSERLVVRRQLIARLNEERDRPLKLVIAGAGYGKSILMSQWLDRCDCNYSWISLESDCNDPQVFLGYLVAGIRQKFPENMLRSEQLARSHQKLTGELLLQTLTNELQELPEPLILVFDDFHLVSNNVILTLFNQLIKFIPEGLQIAIVSRMDPPLNKSRLLAYQQVCEIRMADIRMNRDEIRELAESMIGTEIPADTIRLIEMATEGWALGVNLNVQELNDRKTRGSDGLNRLYKSSNLGPFLFNLMKARLSPFEIELTLVTSLFDRFSFELIEELFRDSGKPALQGELFKESVRKILDLDSPFLIALDEDKRCHRLHHLIREILKERAFDTFSTQQIEKFYKRGSKFFAKRDSYEEAIKYSILGGDERKAVEIIISNWEKLMDYGQNLILKRWIEMLPTRLPESNPDLLVIKAYLCDTAPDFKSMAKYLEEASKGIDRKRSSPRLLGSFASVHSAMSCYTNSMPEALEFANLALDTLAHDQHFLLDYAQNFKVIALNSLESYEAAKAFLIKCRSKLNQGEKLRLMRSHVIQMFIDWYGAKLEDIKFSGRIVVDICKEEKVWWFYRVGFYYLGQFHYMKNDVDKVYAYIDQGIDCALNSSPIWSFHLYYTGALAALARNDVAKAQAYVQSVRELLQINGIPEYEAYIRAFEVEIALRRNEIKMAWELNQHANYDIHPPIYYYYIPQFTRIKLYMRMDDEFLLKQAGEQIQQMKESIRENKIHHALIQVTLLEAIWDHRSGKEIAALNCLREAIALVHEADYIRVFLDFGQSMRQLLELFPQEEKNSPLLINVLNAFRYEFDSEERIQTDDLLSLKERELMSLLEKGLLNKEIAHRMCLSESTIKTYLYRIYQKLEVNNRVSALQRIKEI